MRLKKSCTNTIFGGKTLLPRFELCLKGQREETIGRKNRKKF